MIEICNLHHETPSKVYDRIVDRTSPLGNEIIMLKESDRNKVCDQYQ